MCAFCEGKDVMTSAYYNISAGFDNIVDHPVLNVTDHKCPPHSQCCMNGVPISVAFEINYCPLCGSKLTDDRNGV